MKQINQADQQLARQAIGLLDLTSLSNDDDAERVISLCQRALTPFGPVAAVCVFPRFVTLARKTLDRLGASAIRVATVVNFPYGGPNVASAVSETEAVLKAGANEVDLVYPYRSLLMGDTQTGKTMVSACRELCAGRARLKVILETGELRDPQMIRQASQDAIAAGADFLKTSTGKVLINATEQAARIMLEAIAERGGLVGLKAAGGIRTFDDARTYIELAKARFGADWVDADHLRLGASGLLDELLAQLEWSAAPPTKRRGRK
ncbi:deoxyribose-phosphate aldolase [Pseudomonas gingeri]|uniref:deoxyribose-phosphate aldolase n=1 Tax=Pseudomonas gingeri TaxID=117681 RepID=UPI0015A3B9D5|nr:deoxyribose-phosphate aldolase [Pseudomonas gingeri]NVZ62801.1 deoxyribose-phosphate aldolase [Pseudomonas gingeri]NVZ78490.1 deoxyribose-phosphate aldolase [Pseudomonas gingeri]